MHIVANDLSREDTSEAITDCVIITAESDEHNVVVSNMVPRGDTYFKKQPPEVVYKKRCS